MKLTDKQNDARLMLSGDATNYMLFGGSRSGKTFLLVRQIVIRALMASRSRHAIFRFRFNHVKNSIGMDTLPKVFELCFPGLTYTLDKTDWFFQLPNGSQIWLAGLDDKDRTEKVLGQEYSTIYFNECSQIGKSARDTAMTRLAQTCSQDADGSGDPLALRAYYDCNPPSKAHWTFQLFVNHIDPDSKKPVEEVDYQCMQMNPDDNRANLPKGYIEKTLAALPARKRKRYLAGEFADATPNALWTDEIIERFRHIGGELPDMQRLLVSVDPSGASDADAAEHDAIGIIVGGLGTDGNCYVLEDLTVSGGPSVWGHVATSAFDRHGADAIVGEGNYGGAMVEHVIQTARARTPYKSVTATRGKVVRAEPISSLYEQGKVRHVGVFSELEEELCAFSTFGYTGERSPNRADALVWLVTELFPGLVKPEKKKAKVNRPVRCQGRGTGWMA